MFFVGVIDYVLNYGLLMKGWIVILFGIVYGVVYYGLFCFFICKFNMVMLGCELVLIDVVMELYVLGGFVVLVVGVVVMVVVLCV